MLNDPRDLLNTDVDLLVQETITTLSLAKYQPAQAKDIMSLEEKKLLTDVITAIHY